MLKQQYRELAESIIEQKKKLVLVRKMKRDVETELIKRNGYVKYNEASLKEYESRLASLEKQIFGLETQTG